jgi:hypothetical protein
MAIASNRQYPAIGPRGVLSGVLQRVIGYSADRICPLAPCLLVSPMALVLGIYPPPPPPAPASLDRYQPLHGRCRSSRSCTALAASQHMAGAF